MEHSQLRSLKQKWLQNQRRPPLPLDRVRFKTDLASPRATLPVDSGLGCWSPRTTLRSPPVPTPTTDLDIIYRPELHGNHCVCCCCGNGMRSGRQAKAADVYPAARLAGVIRGHPGMRGGFPSHVPWGLARVPEAAPPGCLLGFIRRLDETTQNDVRKPG